MNILVTDPYDSALSVALFTEAVNAGVSFDTVSLAVETSAIDRYRLGVVPCLARLHNGVAVYVTKDTNAVATFDADADNAVAAIEAENV